jgi:hypothetical protein
MKPLSDTMATDDPILELTMSSCNQGHQCNDKEDSKKCPPINHERSVSFSLHNHVEEIAHLKDMSEEEVESIWISPHELAKIRQTCIRLATLSDLRDDKKERGLEQQTSSEMARKEHIRCRLYKAVSAIQEYQIKNKVSIPDILAGICQKYSAAYELEAHVVGLRDEVQVFSSSR